MATLAPSFSVRRDDIRREVHYTVEGLFAVEKVDELLAELMAKSKPFIDERQPFKVLGDLRNFSVQPRDVVGRMELAQETSAKVGVTRMAIVYSSVLQMQQLRRVSTALEIAFFQDMGEAVAWLRSDKA